MITRLGRRALEIGVGLFALLGFAFVPLGKKTGLEHVKAIIATEPAREAGREMLAAGEKLRAKILESLPTHSGSPASPAPSAPKQSKESAGPPLVCIAPILDDLAPDAGAPRMEN